MDLLPIADNSAKTSLIMIFRGVLIIRLANQYTLSCIGIVTLSYLLALDCHNWNYVVTVYFDF